MDAITQLLTNPRITARREGNPNTAGACVVYWMQRAQRATDVKAVADGLTMILKQFEGTLGRIGIQRVPTVGSGFDPSVHEAIQQVETDEHPPGTVVAEVQPGYKQEDRLVRAAMVVVAKPKAGGNDGKADPAGPTN